MSYENLAGFAQTWGLLYFVAIFVAVVIYAYSPRNRARFERAALLVLKDDEEER